DLLDPQALEAPLTGRLQVIGPAVGRPAPRPGTDEAALGGDDQVLRVRLERLGDQRLAHLGPVGIGGVDEVDLELHGPAEHGLGLLALGWVPPDPGPGEAHGAEAEAVDGEVGADADGARG